MVGNSRRLRRRRRPRDERGGAISLWVVLMVPVSAFAAVAAMAGPQRLAAESSVQEAADDLAAFAVAWRDGQRLPRGQLNSFPSHCASRTDQQHGAIATLNNNIPALSPPPAQGPNDPDFRDFSDLFDQYETEFEDLLRQFKQPPPPPLRPVHSPPVPPIPPDPNAANYQALLVAYRALLVAYQASFDTYEAENVVRVAALDSRLNDLSRRLDGWDETCRVLLEALAGDLGNLGVDFGDLRGSYSDSLETSALTGTCTIPLHTTKYACEASPGAWIPDSQFAVPCRTAEGTVCSTESMWRYPRTGCTRAGPRRRCGPTGSPWPQSRPAG